MHQLIAYWFHLLDHWGYAGIILLMAMESSIFPVPSEIVIPPAIFWAEQGRLNFCGVIFAGTLGSYLGSAITYGLTRWLGRIVVEKFGRFFFVTPEKLERAERFIERYQAGGIFFARLLPVVRHLISIPAGLVRMNFRVFSLMTIAGSFLWCTILAWFGKRIAQQHPELIDNPEALMHAIKSESGVILISIALFCALYFLAMKLTASRKAVL